MRRKIIFYEPYYFSFTGAQQSLFWFLKEMDKTKFEPIVVTPGKGKLTANAQAEGIKTKIIPFSNSLDVFGGQLKKYGIIKKIIFIFALLNYNLKFIAYLLKARPDVVYCNNLRGLITIGGAAKLMRIPVVWYIRIDKSNGLFDKLGLRLADKIVTISNGVREIFTEYELEKYKEKFKTIYTGFDLDEFSSAKESQYSVDNNFIIATAGSLIPRKGYDNFIELAREIVKNNNEVKFLAAGASPKGNDAYYHKLINKVQEYDLEDRVEFVGWVNNISDFLAASDLFVLASKNEGLPRVVIEAMAMGKPVVATNAGGTAEAVNDKITGFVVDKGDYTALVEKVQYMIDNQEQAQKMGRKGRKRVEDTFSLRSYIKEFEGVLEDI